MAQIQSEKQWHISINSGIVVRPVEAKADQFDFGTKKQVQLHDSSQC